MHAPTKFLSSLDVRYSKEKMSNGVRFDGLRRFTRQDVVSHMYCNKVCMQPIHSRQECSLNSQQTSHNADSMGTTYQPLTYILGSPQRRSMCVGSRSIPPVYVPNK